MENEENGEKKEQNDGLKTFENITNEVTVQSIYAYEINKKKGN